jgi:hypothetical protein
MTKEQIESLEKINKKILTGECEKKYWNSSLHIRFKKCLSYARRKR